MKSSLRNTLFISAFLAAGSVSLAEPVRAANGYTSSKPMFETAVCQKVVNADGSRDALTPEKISVKVVNGGLADVSFRGETVRVLNFQTHEAWENSEVMAVAIKNNTLYTLHVADFEGDEKTVTLWIDSLNGYRIADYYATGCKFTGSTLGQK